MQFAWYADATIHASKNESKYLFLNETAVLIISELISNICVISQRNNVFSSHTSCDNFNFLWQALNVSIITCELITGY